MRAEYKRDLQNNYLILELNQEEDEYCLRMAEQNDISGLLEFHSSKRDGKRYLHYEITSRQPLDGFYERKAMGYQDILNILTDIRDTMDAMQRYLLKPAHLVFAPEYIFVGADRRAAFCYFPEETEEVRITALAEFILKKLDHEDGQAVTLGYLFYQRVCEKNFSFTQVWKELIIAADQERRRDTEPGQSPECRQEQRSGKCLERDDFGGNPGKGKKTNSEEYPDFGEEYDLQQYEVIHKERRKKKPGKKLDWLFEKVHPLVLFSGLFFLAVIEILFCLQVIHLTEAGGMFFLMLSVEMLMNRFWKSRRENKKSYKNYEPYEEDDHRYEELQEEMYQEDEAEIGETCCLTSVLERKGIRLIHVAGETEEGLYPDICLENEVLYVGKRKGESDVFLDSLTVSRIHARLEGKEGRYFVKDLNSRNGTYCNEERLHPQEQREIFVGDRISFAQIEYRAVRL